MDSNGIMAQINVYYVLKEIIDAYRVTNGSVCSRSNIVFDVKGRGHNFDRTTVLMPDTKGLDSLVLTSVLFTG